MSTISEWSQSAEYLSFRSSVPLRRIVVDSDDSKGWRVYDCGPKTVQSPLICLPPVSGTADVFFRQALALSARGIRVILAEAPPYWSVKEWCDGFRRLIDYLNLTRVHLFGASLGGYLAQKFAEYTSLDPRVASLVLCNTFSDTSIFKGYESASLYWMLPALVLKKMLMSNFEPEPAKDPDMVKTIDFMVEKLDSLTQSELASRLTLNCTRGYVEAHKLTDLPVTIIDVFDGAPLSTPVKEELYKCYPQAKLAHIKTGGYFPFLSRSAEVNLHLLIHLRQFDNGPLASSDRSLISNSQSES
ncbi:maspardin-like [Anthonomus grandis grandis]|uniref:maspardin-like n=1 Tax=Anthonomus grandis grandis TaxID=2921223 RepID=UPI00216675FD|nr:maspardin-like [Anthonomus grandis grandis]